MDLCREIVWNCPNNGIQCSRIEKVARIYVILAGLNPKFDIVRKHILGQRPIHSLVEVCSEVHLEEDRTSAMSSMTNSAIDSIAFNVRSPSHDNEKHNGKSIHVYGL